VKPTEPVSKSGLSVTPPASADPSPKPVRATSPALNRLIQRAAMLRKSLQFQNWLQETNTSWRIMSGSGEEKAKLLQHVYCGVKSLTEIQPDSDRERLLNQMLNKFEAWQACLEEVS
jgi:hypothetical protein